MSGPPENHPRRIYARVSTVAADGGFQIRLDESEACSPRGTPLLLPTLALAELIAEEWRAQSESIHLADMPATRLAFAAVDRVAAARAQTIAEVIRYADSDLLCYRAQAPESLVRRQAWTWSPLLDWARDELGLDFVAHVGIVHQPQPATVLAGVGALARGADDFALAGLAFGAALFGSAILALAVHAGRLDAGSAMTAARLDEIFQEERWGIDAEAAARAARMAGEATMLARWFRAMD